MGEETGGGSAEPVWEIDIEGVKLLEGIDDGYAVEIVGAVEGLVYEGG